MLLVYSPQITSRLQYIVTTLLKEIAGLTIEITSDSNRFKEYDRAKINYSNNHMEGCFNLQPHPILFETTIQPQEINCFETTYTFEGKPVKAFFKTDRSDISFDVFAASFYLLSRYEEYLPHEEDQYRRYAHTESLAFKENFLHLPLINIWIEELKKTLQEKFQELYFRSSYFKFIPTYDIDIAYAYLNKGFVRSVGGVMKSMFKGQWSVVNERMNVLFKKKPDPYDAYEWLDELHLYCRLRPIYFFLVARQQRGYDRNISISSKAFRQLIMYYARGYKTGLHPSWQSNIDTRILKEEKELLEAIGDIDILRSRQHYLKFDLPETYRRLIEVGIQQEYSMGYGSINGFRASVASSFYWFDLEKNEQTNLLLYPFCFMDANAHFEQKYTPSQGYAELMQFYHVIRKLNGLFITIWHNNFLGQNPQLKGWREVYEIFMKEDIYWD